MRRRKSNRNTTQATHTIWNDIDGGVHTCDAYVYFEDAGLSPPGAQQNLIDWVKASVISSGNSAVLRRGARDCLGGLLQHRKRVNRVTVLDETTPAIHQKANLKQPAWITRIDVTDVCGATWTAVCVCCRAVWKTVTNVAEEATACSSAHCTTPHLRRPVSLLVTQRHRVGAPLGFTFIAPSNKNTVVLYPSSRVQIRPKPSDF